MATNQKLTKVLEGRTVSSVRQRGAELDIDFTDGSTLSVKLEGTSDSVTVTNDNDQVEYES